MDITKEQRSAEMEAICAKMGLALSMLHGIEEQFAQAWLFGVNDKTKRKHKDVNELRAKRDQMTFGALIAAMKEKWSLDPTLEEFLDDFLEERNTFVHRLTSIEGFGMARKKDRERLERRVDIFLDMTFEAHRIFSVALNASIEFSRDYIQREKGIEIESPLSEKQHRDIGEFMSLVEIRRKPEA